MTPQLGPVLLEDLTFNGGLYALFVIPAFFLCWVVFPRALAHRRIQPKQRATSGSILHDFGWSLSSLLVFAVMDFGIVTLERLGIAKSTDVPVEQYGLLALVLSVPALIVLHDAYFYWMHRAVHAPWLFRLVHQVHHRSTDPSPFTSFAFHPLEAVLEHAFALIVVLLFPVHFWALIAWQVFQQFFNMVGHLGYEVYPRWWLAAPLLRLKTASTHHNLHHEKFRGNYGLYFVWWDRWMGTEFADYEQRFLASTAPKALPATSEAVPS